MWPPLILLKDQKLFLVIYCKNNSKELQTSTSLQSPNTTLWSLLTQANNLHSAFPSYMFWLALSPWPLITFQHWSLTVLPGCSVQVLCSTVPLRLNVVNICQFQYTLLQYERPTIAFYNSVSQILRHQRKYFWQLTADILFRVWKKVIK